MACPQCGGEISPEASFCSNCGHKLDPAKYSEASIEQIVRDLSSRQSVRLVGEIWAERGYKTKPIKHNGSVYVLAKSQKDDEKDLIQIGVEDVFSEQRAESLSSLQENRGFDRAYFFSTNTVDSTEIDQTESDQLEYLTPEKLSTLVQRLDLEQFVSTELSDAISETPEAESTGQEDPDSDSTEIPSEPSSATKEDRAAQIISQAAGSSVTEKRLLEQGSTGFLSTANLSEAPLIEYLDAGENPQFIFQNDIKGISIEQYGDVQPDDDYRAFVAITDQRILCVIGQENEDSVVTIPYGELQSVESATGMFKHRITVSDDSRDIDLYIATEAIDDENEVGAAEDFIAARLGTEAGSNLRVTVDGQPLNSVSPDELEDEATTLEMIGAVAVLLVGGVIVLAVLGGIIGVLTSPSDADTGSTEQQLIEKDPGDLVIGLQQLDSGWQRHPDGPRGYTLSRADRDAYAAYWNPDESSQYTGITGLVSEVALLNTTTKSEEVYSREVADIKRNYAVNDVDLGDEAILYEDGNEVYVVFRYRNMVGAITYSQPMSIGLQESKAKQFSQDVIDNAK
ncbi:zinc ribbon domain-containing protein [Halorubrum sp. CSM-61]|uniref:zinc ribbon domain-containing protein n=1 Tax=Halorubrum sp. CSM-61 TaxID=2485838 RepID=UPI000F4C28FB|nr:zinc ribbon domain-containing protein [Halorubrum sp. CSM-61]